MVRQIHSFSLCAFQYFHAELLVAVRCFSSFSFEVKHKGELKHATCYSLLTLKLLATRIAQHIVDICCCLHCLFGTITQPRQCRLQIKSYCIDELRKKNTLRKDILRSLLFLHKEKVRRIKNENWLFPSSLCNY